MLEACIKDGAVMLIIYALSFPSGLVISFVQRLLLDNNKAGHKSRRSRSSRDILTRWKFIMRTSMKCVTHNQDGPACCVDTRARNWHDIYIVTPSAGRAIVIPTEFKPC